MKTTTVYFEEPRKAVLREEQLPEIGPGMVCAKSLLTAISTGTEMTAYTGEFPREGKWAQYLVYPFPVGYSQLGEVVKVGDGVTAVKPGDKVVGYKPHSTYGVYYPGDLMVPVPANVDDASAASFALPLIAINGVRRAELQLGECAVVYGLGPLGQIAAQLSRLNGARPVVGVDLCPERRKLAETLGIDAALDGANPALKELVRDVSRGRMADVVFEVTGNQNAIPGEFGLLRRQGRMVLLSSPRGPTLFDFHDMCNSPSFTIIGAHNSSHSPHETPRDPWTESRDMEIIFELLAKGELHLNELITHRMAWTQAAEAYELLYESRGKTGIVLFNWQK